MLKSQKREKKNADNEMLVMMALMMMNIIIFHVEIIFVRIWHANDTEYDMRK